MWNYLPHAGHVQASRRPAIVSSTGMYNRKRGLALFCPITYRIKGYPFEAVLPDTGTIKGVILADRIKSLDWRARRAEFACHAARGIVNDTSGKSPRHSGARSLLTVWPISVVAKYRNCIACTPWLAQATSQRFPLRTLIFLKDSKSAVSDGL